MKPIICGGFTISDVGSRLSALIRKACRPWQAMPGSGLRRMAAAFFAFFLFAQCQKMPWGTLGKLPERFPMRGSAAEGKSMKLTKNAIAMLGLDGKTDAIFFDDEVPGFGIRLRLAAGGKVARNWIVQWKRSGATNRIRIGSAGVLDLKAAREEARKILGRVALGEDPSAD